MIVSPRMRIAVGLTIGLAVSSSHGLAQTPPRSSAQNSQRITTLIDTLGKTRTPASAALSPDGVYVAWSVAGDQGMELHLTGIASAGTAQDGAWERVLSPDTIADVVNGRPGVCPSSDPIWSPDGKQLGFLSACASVGSSFVPADQANLFVWTLATNAIKQVSHLHGAVTSPAWSPDGKSIAFLYVENATRSAGAVDAMKPWAGVIGEDGIEVQRVYSVNLVSGKGWWDTPPNLHVYEFAFAPAPGQIVFIGAKPPGENNWWLARLYKTYIPLAPLPEYGQVCVCPNTTCECPTDEQVLLDPATIAGPLHGLQIAVPRFSPDGTQIAFIGGLMSDQGSTGGDIYVIPSTGLNPGATPKDLTPNRRGSPAWLQWTGPETVEFTEHLGGDTHIGFLNAATGTVDPENSFTLPGTVNAGNLVSSLSLAKTGEAFILSSFGHPPEVWAAAGSAPAQLTHLNDKLKPVWGKSESITWTNDGFNIQGWLLYPVNFDPAKKYPLIVSVHGGPSAAVTPRWPDANYGPAPFSALGYFVFMPNPRGSFGQGEKFTQANVKDFGYGDMRDILAGVNLLEQRFPIDKTREGLTGWSYGGFMTMFGVTQTTRFHAAVAGAGIANWQSYYGENSIDQWMTPFFGATVYDDPAVYAKSSPINFIQNVKTPTLVVVGDRDGECPAPQSFEFWHALKAEGVKTQLVIYPDEGHHFRDPGHRRDVLERALEWFEAQMPEVPAR